MSGDYSKVGVGQKPSAQCFSMGNVSSDPASDVEEFRQYFMKEHEKLISQANKQFGLNCWSHSVTNQELECLDYIDGKYSVAASAIVKVVLKQGIYHEEFGSGFSFKMANKGISIAYARQEAKLDALRKVIASFSYNTECEEYTDAKPDAMQNVKNIQNQHSPVQEFSLNNKTTSFHHTNVSHSSTKTPTSNSPLNTSKCVPFTSPKVNVSVSAVSEQLEQRDLRAERKRKQQQLQEEYRSRMKLKEKLNATDKENSDGQFLIDAAIQDEPSFLSTQEVDEMMRSAAVLLKPESLSYRIPLISSPVQNIDRCWASNNCMKTPENTRSNRMFIN